MKNSKKKSNKYDFIKNVIGENVPITKLDKLKEYLTKEYSNQTKMVSCFYVEKKKKQINLKLCFK